MKMRPGPKLKPVSQLKRHAIMVKLNDAELAAVKRKADKQPLGAYLRERGLA